MSAYSRVRPGAPGDIVRRKDSLGRTYHYDRVEKKRTTKSEWQAERDAIAFERAIFRTELDERREIERRNAPFPPGVSETGVPMRPDAGREPSGGSGEYDGEELAYEGFEPIAIDGEDDT